MAMESDVIREQFKQLDNFAVFSEKNPLEWDGRLSSGWWSANNGLFTELQWLINLKFYLRFLFKISPTKYESSR